MVRELTIDGTSLLSAYSVVVSGESAYNGAIPSIETVEVPGRNGDLVYSNRRYNNLELSYPAMIQKGFESKFHDLRAFLLSNTGYRKIQDSKFPTIYRMGRIANSLDPSTIAWNSDGGLFDIVFDCKPQRYLNSGDTQTTYTSLATITNPTLFDALPILRVYGAGTVTLNGVSVTIASHNYSYTVLDCELQDAYYGTVNLNSYISVSGNNFPVLSPGSNTLTLGSGITRVVVTPRWWTL